MGGIPELGRVDRPCRRPARPADPADGKRRRPPVRQALRARLAHPPQADPWPRQGSRPSRPRGASGSSPVDPSSGRSRRPPASHSAPLPRPAARATARWRRRPPASGPAPSPPPGGPAHPCPGHRGPRPSSSAGSARRSRSSRSSSAASAPTLAGSADDPTRRQACPTLPMSATETVAAPRSTVANARGSVVTRAC